MEEPRNGMPSAGGLPWYKLPAVEEIGGERPREPEPQLGFMARVARGVVVDLAHVFIIIIILLVGVFSLFKLFEGPISSARRLVK